MVEKAAGPYRLIDDFRQHWLLAVLLCVAMLLWGWFDVRRRGRIDPLRTDAHKTDFTVYTVAGSAFFDGRNPYEVTNVRGWSYLYPPLFALTVAPLARLDSQTQTFVWFCISIAFAVGCYAESRRWLELLANELAVRDAERSFLLLPVALTVALPAFNCLQRGQIAVLQLYLMLVGFRSIATPSRRWHTLAGGVLLAIPIVLKITPALPVCCLVLMLGVSALRQGTGWLRVLASAFGVLTGIALTLFVIPSAIVGWNDNVRHLHAFSDKVLQRASNVRNDDFGGEVDSPRNQSLDNAVYRLGLWLVYQPDVGADGQTLSHVERPRVGELPRVPLASQISFAVNCALVTVLFLQVIALGWNGRTSALCVGFSLACALTLIVAPVARGHYFVLLLPVLLAVPLCLVAQGRLRSARLAVWVPAIITLLHYAFLNSLGRLGMYGLSIALWYVAISCLLAAPVIGIWWNGFTRTWSTWDGRLHPTRA